MTTRQLWEYGNYLLLGILERTVGSWNIFGKLMNSIVFLSKKIFYLLDGGFIRWWTFIDLDSVTCQVAKNNWENYHDEKAHLEYPLFFFVVFFLILIPS